MAMLWRSACNRNTTTSSTNAENNGKGSEEGACPVLGQESASSISTAEGSKRFASHCNKNTRNKGNHCSGRSKGRCSRQD
eukprot:2163116-Ditylum_brightwellii.AAC.1